MRTGFGTDLHRLIEGEGIKVGGINIPCKFACMAHSDGDALLHAATDATLGALGEGDIGDLFPDTDNANKGRNSEDFFTCALNMMKDKGYKICNIDSTVHLQEPKLSPFKKAIKENIARICKCEPDKINIKAKSGESLGPVGECKAIATEVIILLEEI